MNKGISILILMFLSSNIFASTANQIKNKTLPRIYKVRHIDKKIIFQGKWDSSVWEKVQPLDVNNFMGSRPEHFPKTQAKLLYDDKFLYVIFRVEDKYVLATAQNNQQLVCDDSCVEFFFTAGADVSNGYFNLEMNCGGTLFFHFQKKRKVDEIALTLEDCNQIRVFHSEPKIIQPERIAPATWTVEYAIPYEILEKYCKIVKPGSGVIWRANFYKCSYKTSKPHWLTWSPVNYPEPNFHLPEFFGTLEFE